MPAPERFEPHWPAGADGVALYPGVHGLAYEDAALRVVDVHIAPRSSERPHTHAWPSVMAVDRPTSLAVRWVDGRGRTRLVFERTRGPRRPAGLELQWLEPEPYHFVENTSDDDYRALRFEWKAPPAAGALAPQLACEGARAHGVLREGGVRGFRLRPAGPGPLRLRVSGAGALLLDPAGGAGLGVGRSRVAPNPTGAEPVPIALAPGRPRLWALAPDVDYAFSAEGPAPSALWLVVSTSLGPAPSTPRV